jgi:hypothetical protein
MVNEQPCLPSIDAHCDVIVDGLPGRETILRTQRDMGVAALEMGAKDFVLPFRAVTSRKYVKTRDCAGPDAPPSTGGSRES